MLQQLLDYNNHCVSIKHVHEHIHVCVLYVLAQPDLRHLKAGDGWTRLPCVFVSPRTATMYVVLSFSRWLGHSIRARWGRCNSGGGGGGGGGVSGVSVFSVILHGIFFFLLKSNFSDSGQNPWTIVRRFDQITFPSGRS